MIVVADAGPLRYLVLIEHSHLLPALYGPILVPPAVIDELSRERTPRIVHEWIVRPPDWLQIQAPTHELVPFDESLGAGERAAIARWLRIWRPTLC